jgi:putative FmdB family regulatory protein
MPRYDIRCRTCGDTFEVTRPMAEADAPAPCPAGHDDTVRLLSMVSVSTGAAAPPSSGGSGGGCCGGGCCG